MQGKGMNAQKLQERKAALLKAERLEMQVILRDAESMKKPLPPVSSA